MENELENNEEEGAEEFDVLFGTSNDPSQNSN
jgi:hypothetical protein